MLATCKVNVVFFFGFSGMLSEQELFSAFEENYDKFYKYLENVETTNPERKVRHSDTVFLAPSAAINFFDNLRYRFVFLTFSCFN